MIYVADPDCSFKQAQRIAERLYKLSPCPPYEWITVPAASILMQRPVNEVMQMLRGNELSGVIAHNTDVLVHSANVLRFMREDIHKRLIDVEQQLVDQVFDEQLNEVLGQDIEDEASLD